MSYDNSEFWEEYLEYKKETLVAHDAVWSLCYSVVHKVINDPYQVIDFGAGPDPFSHTFFDLNPSRCVNCKERYSIDAVESINPHKYTICADYTDVDFVTKVKDVASVGFLGVSFFSLDVVLPREEATRVIDALFDLGAGAMITSGFYYKGREDQEFVVEGGSLRSYQVLPNSVSAGQRHAEEFKFEINVPSRMFGEDVVEVWRVLVPTHPQVL